MAMNMYSFFFFFSTFLLILLFCSSTINPLTFMLYSSIDSICQRNSMRSCRYIIYLFCSKYISMMRRRQWNHHQLLYLFACWLCHELASVFMNIQQRMKTKIRVICERARSNETDRLKPVQCDSHGFIWIGDVVAVVMEKWQRCRIHQWRYYEKEVEKMRMKKKDVMKRAKKKKKLNWLLRRWKPDRISDRWWLACCEFLFLLRNRQFSWPISSSGGPY